MLKLFEGPARAGVLIAAAGLMLGCGVTSMLPIGGTPPGPDLASPAEGDAPNSADPGTTVEEEPAPAEAVPTDEAAVPQGELVFSSGPCFNSYFPIIDGRTMNYIIESPVDPEFPLSQTFRTTGPDSFVSTLTFEDGDTLEAEWQCREDGLLNADMGIANLSDLGTITYTDLQIEGTTIPGLSDFVVGNTWQTTYSATGESDINGLVLVLDVDMVMDSTFVGFETIIVPAGTYEAARIDTMLHIVGSTNGVAVMEFDVPSSNWYAENVGLVQSTASDFMMEGESLQQLVSISSD